MSTIVDNGNVMRWACDGYDDKGNETFKPMDFPQHAFKYGTALASKHWHSFNELTDDEYQNLASK